jgi:predicted trehalose synthase
VLEKTIYEVRYELANRPDWVSIPIAGIREVLGSPFTPVNGTNSTSP